MAEGPEPSPVTDNREPIIMKTILLAAAAAACLLPTTSALAQERGDWVLAPWQGSSQLFPGVIQSNNGRSLDIRFDDGTRETVAIRETRPFDWRSGTRVECRWQNGTTWYSGRITMMAQDGLTMDVAYDDGDRERTNTGRCRTPN